MENEISVGEGIFALASRKVLQMVLKIGRDSFQGLSKLYGPKGLGAIIRGLAADNAIARVSGIATNTLKLTDNSTGEVGNDVYDLVLPPSFNASVSGGASLTDLNTALTALENAHRVIGTALNVARTKLGLTIMSFDSGVVATPLTVAALTKSVASTASVLSVQYASALVALKANKESQRRLTNVINETVAALGMETMPNRLSGDFTHSEFLVNNPTVVAATATPNTISMAKAPVDLYLTVAAGNVATLAAFWNDAVDTIIDTPMRVVAK